MPWYPKARRYDVRRDRGYKGRGSARRITPVRINHHTAVVNADTLDRQANDLSAAYPHFMIGRNGQVTQYQDTDFMARADLHGNPNSISIETWDGYKSGAPGYWKHNSDVPPWTDAQVEAIIELDAWLLDQHKSIPLRLATDSRPGTSSHGLSWHRLGCDGHFPNEWPWWGRRSGGTKYSNSFGKHCPGDRRIAQVVDVIFPALKAGGYTPTGPSARPDDEIQLALAVLGFYDPGPSLQYLDGINGDHQKAAVRDYQRARGLHVDGWWGTNTNKHFEEHDMSKIVDQIAKAVSAEVPSIYQIRQGQSLHAGKVHEAVISELAPLNAKVDGLSEAVSQLATGQGLDPAAITAAIEAGVNDALDRVRVVIAENTENEEG